MAEAPFDHEAARAFLLKEAYAPVFFDKLAAYGIKPADEAEAEALVRMSLNLLNASRLEQEKQGTARPGFIHEAAQRLDGLLAQHGYAPPAAPNLEEEQYVKRAAAAVGQRPQVRQAAAGWSQYLRSAG